MSLSEIFLKAFVTGIGQTTGALTITLPILYTIYTNIGAQLDILLDDVDVARKTKPIYTRTLRQEDFLSEI